MVSLQAVLSPLKRIAQTDLRSLALMRILLGTIVALDLVVSWTNVDAFYTDHGVLSRELLHTSCWPGAGAWSLHDWSGSALWQRFLIAIGILAAAGMTLGWRTRVCVIISAILWGSLEIRNPMVINGADPAIRLFLFWSIFLPLGAVWSLDSRKTPPPASLSFTGVPVLALWVQLGCIYLFSAMLKTDDTWNKDFTAVWQVMHADIFARPTAVWLRLFPELCRWMTQATINLERWGPWLLLIPVAVPWFRLLAVLAFVSFHLGIAITMDIGSFPWVMVAAWCAAIPSMVWNFRLPGKMQATAPDFCSEAHVNWLRWMRDAFCVFCMVFIVLWNLRTTAFKRWEPWFPRSLNPLGFALRLDQYWTMFAPYPWLDDGWFVLAAKLTDGSKVDLLKPHLAPTAEKPAHSSADYKDSRWQKYLSNLWMSQHERHRRYLAHYLVNRWNETHGALSQVTQWELAYMLERTRKDATGIHPVERHLLVRSPLPGTK
jgi:hypothetical protein